MSLTRIWLSVAVDDEDTRIEVVASSEDADLDVIVSEDGDEAGISLDRGDVIQLVDALNQWLHPEQAVQS